MDKELLRIKKAEKNLRQFFYMMFYPIDDDRVEQAIYNPDCIKGMEYLIDQLSESQQIAYRLWLEGYPYTEIGRRLDISSEGVRFKITKSNQFFLRSKDKNFAVNGYETELQSRKQKQEELSKIPKETESYKEYVKDFYSKTLAEYCSKHDLFEERYLKAFQRNGLFFKTIGELDAMADKEFVKYRCTGVVGVKELRKGLTMLKREYGIINTVIKDFS